MSWHSVFLLATCVYSGVHAALKVWRLSQPDVVTELRSLIGFVAGVQAMAFAVLLTMLIKSLMG